MTELYQHGPFERPPQLFNPATPKEITAAGVALMKGTGRILTPEEFDQMAKTPPPKMDRKFRKDGTRRIDNSERARGFRCDDQLWNRANSHAKARGMSVSQWLRHAIERMAGEERRQKAYSEKRPKTKPAAAAKGHKGKSAV